MSKSVLVRVLVHRSTDAAPLLRHPLRRPWVGSLTDSYRWLLSTARRVPPAGAVTHTTTRPASKGTGVGSALSSLVTVLLSAVRSMSAVRAQKVSSVTAAVRPVPPTRRYVRSGLHHGMLASTGTPFPPSAAPVFPAVLPSPRHTDGRMFMSYPTLTATRLITLASVASSSMFALLMPVPMPIDCMLGPRRPDLLTPFGSCGDSLPAAGRGLGAAGTCSLLAALRRPRRSARRMKWQGSGPPIAISRVLPISTSMKCQVAMGAVANQQVNVTVQ